MPIINTKLKVNFSSDIDPVEFILSEQVEGMHRIKKYASLADPSIADERKIQAYCRKAAFDVNNYKLVLQSCKGKMPDEKSEKLLELVLDPMNKAYEGRSTLGKEMVGVLSEIVLAYHNLCSSLKSKD